MISGIRSFPAEEGIPSVRRVSRISCLTGRTSFVPGDRTFDEGWLITGQSLPSLSSISP